MTDSKPKDTFMDSFWYYIEQAVCIIGLISMMSLQNVFMENYNTKYKSVNYNGRIIIENFFTYYVAMFVKNLLRQQPHPWDKRFIKYILVYGICSYMTSILAAYSLKHISYILFIICRSTKLLTVLLVALLNRDFEYLYSLTISKYICLVLITVGSLIFGYSNMTNGTKEIIETTTLGITCSLLAIIGDGMVANYQRTFIDKAQKNYGRKLTAMDYMISSCYVQGGIAIVMGIYSGD